MVSSVNTANSLDLRNSNCSNTSSDSRFRVGLKMVPSVLNNLSTAAEDGSEVLYLTNNLASRGYLFMDSVEVIPSDRNSSISSMNIGFFGRRLLKKSLSVLRLFGLLQSLSSLCVSLLIVLLKEIITLIIPQRGFLAFVKII